MLSVWQGIDVNALHTSRPSDDLISSQHFQISPQGAVPPPLRTYASGQGVLLGTRPYISLVECLKQEICLFVCLFLFLMAKRHFFGWEELLLSSWSQSREQGFITPSKESHKNKRSVKKSNYLLDKYLIMIAMAVFIF